MIIRTRAFTFPSATRDVPLISNPWPNDATSGAMSYVRREMPRALAHSRASSGSGPSAGPSPDQTPTTLAGPTASTHSFATREEATPPLIPTTRPFAPESLRWWRMNEVMMATCSSRNFGWRETIGRETPRPLNNLSRARSPARPGPTEQPFADSIGGRSQILLRERREVLAHNPGRAAPQRLRDDIASDDPVVEGVVLPVGSEVDVEVRDSTAEHVHVDEICARRVLEGVRRPPENGPEGPRLAAVQVGDVRNVALRLQIREPEHLGLEARRQTPHRVLPHLHATKFAVALSPPADHAVARRPWRHRGRESIAR